MDRTTDPGKRTRINKAIFYSNREFFLCIYIYIYIFIYFTDLISAIKIA